jgi:uncharacterized damage-inducible protein DinB
MADWDALAEGFRFDLWANRRWLDCLSGKGWVEPDRLIFEHILAAQKIWVTRVGGESPLQMPKVELTEEAMVALNAQWLDALQEHRHDPVISYRRTTGQELNLPLSQIAMHVTNHGTYHRGELRGLCRSRDDNDFPETDRGGFYFATHP